MSGDTEAKVAETKGVGQPEAALKAVDLGARSVTETKESEYTGIEAQRDPDFGARGNSVADLEDELESAGEVDLVDYRSTLADYPNFIVLPKREVSQFIRAVEPLTKTTVDQYGKSVQVSSIDTDAVELRYADTPFRLAMKISNKSQKTVNTFYLHVSLLKRLITESYASLVIVEHEGGYHIAVCDSLLFIETIPLVSDEYKFEKNKPSKLLDKELGTYVFKKIGPVLSFSDRSSEKVAIVKDGYCYFNTGVFSAKIKSPFTEEGNLLLFKSAVDLLGVLLDIAKVDVRYHIVGDSMIVETDGLIYTEIPVTSKIEDHFSPAVARALGFEAGILIVNDAMPKLFSLARSLEYLADIATIGFTKENMIVKLHSQDLSKSSTYRFLIVEGAPEIEAEMKVSATVMKPYLEVTGTDVRYAFNDIGLCMSNDKGNFIVRRTS